MAISVIRLGPGLLVLLALVMAVLLIFGTRN
jgi:hypothetical protein